MVDLQQWSLATLASATGSDVEFLTSVVDRTVACYAQSTISKRTGGTRVLHIPSEDLLRVQQWLLRNVLEGVSPHRASFAYTEGRSVKKCAEQHLGARWLVRMDLSEFFPSIDERSVYYLMLKEFGASKLFAFQLARLLTCVPNNDELIMAKQTAPYESTYRRRYTTGYRPQFLGRLPQGSPTSGIIANLIARRLDNEIASLSYTEGLTYTRYADDIFVSSGKDRGRGSAEDLITNITRIAMQCGFQVNPSKTRIAREGGRISVLGLHVDGEALRLPKTTRRRIDGHLRAMSKFGIESHSEHIGHRGPGYLLAHIDGLLSYANDVSKGWARPRIATFHKVLEDDGREIRTRNR